MFIHETQIRIRYADTDQMGVVYYGNYATFYEIGRTEALRTLGINYKDMEASGTMLPVIECNSKFIKAAKYDDLLTIKTILIKIPSVKIIFNYEIYNQNDELIHTGDSTLVFLDTKTQRPKRIPENVYEKLQPFFEEVNQ